LFQKRECEIFLLSIKFKLSWPVVGNCSVVERLKLIQVMEGVDEMLYGVLLTHARS
jgi:hypothetical protein